MAFALATAVSLASGGSLVPAVKGFPQDDGLDCGIEPMHHYASEWNDTALTLCRGDPRPEQVCIVGGGMSGVHMGWLLKRRGFEKTVVLEANDRLGGKVYTLTGGVGGGDVTREMGAAFLSPDYVEVRALVARFGQSEVPISVKHMMRFHWNGTVGPSSEWYAAQVAAVTKTTDPAANAAAVSAALSRYFAVHAGIFGNYTGRFPPRPAALAQIAGTGDDFITRNELAVLRPLFYQFFVLQGMGLLETMPAYYLLKWVSPASLRAGGFGNDQDTPLAMLEEGFGAVAAALVADVDLEVLLGARVLSISRADSVATVLYRQPDKSTASIACDLLVLSGPIPKYVSGSTDGTVPPILTPPTLTEKAVFGTMQPMQFLVSLVEFGTAPGPPPPPFEQYQALEYWPENYPGRDCGVIVRRNIKSAESGAAGGAIGGVQSYSYWPAPVCNESMHWASQQRWAAQQGLTIEKLYRQYYSDTYLYHYNTSEVEVDGKPWAVHRIQFENRTLYVGGAAGYETVEDSLQFNLELVDRFFRSSGPVPLAEQPALEQLVFELDCGDVDRFIDADNATWTQFLITSAPGFHSKQVTVNPGTTGTSCEVWAQVWWSSREKWKSIPASTLSAVQKNFVEMFGSDPSKHAFPSADGLSIVSDHQPTTGPTTGPVDDGYARARLAAGHDEPQATEVNYYNVSCGRVGEFIRVDNATWSLFLSAQPGFRQKLTLLPDADAAAATSNAAVAGGTGGADGAGGGGREENCTVWTMTRWETRTLWHAVPLSGIQQTAAKFAAAFRQAVYPNRFPTAAGLTVVRDVPAPGFPPKVRLPAIAGNDIVAYFALKAGDPDVPGSPAFKRFVDPTPLLPKTLLAMHPEPYEFWFSSDANAKLFDADPWRYIPRFGGHCTHGIASRNDLTPPLLVDGRVAFTCVNTTQWAVVNGSLYMNSCGMYADFMKDPDGDIRKARLLWAEWFGERTSGAVGPINDACFQNGGLWDGPPDWVGQLIPPRCVIN